MDVYIALKFKNSDAGTMHHGTPDQLLAQVNGYLGNPNVVQVRLLKYDGISPIYPAITLNKGDTARLP